jgi:hypothetical protein
MGQVKRGHNQTALDEDDERESEQHCADAIERKHGGGDGGFHADR